MDNATHSNRGRFRQEMTSLLAPFLLPACLARRSEASHPGDTRRNTTGEIRNRVNRTVVVGLKFGSSSTSMVALGQTLRSDAGVQTVLPHPTNKLLLIRYHPAHSSRRDILACLEEMGLDATITAY